MVQFLDLSVDETFAENRMCLSCRRIVNCDDLQLAKIPASSALLLWETVMENEAKLPTCRRHSDSVNDVTCRQREIVSGPKKGIWLSLYQGLSPVPCTCYTHGWMFFVASQASTVHCQGVTHIGTQDQSPGGSKQKQLVKAFNWWLLDYKTRCSVPS